MSAGQRWWWRALALLALPVSAAAQNPSVGDVPTGPAAIHGRVIHPEGPGWAAGVEVVLYAIGAEGNPGVRRAVSDAGGRFRFDSVSNESGVVYLVGARYAGVPFPGERVAFAPGQIEQQVEVRIAEATPDPGAIEVTQSTLRLEWVGSELSVSETHQLRNPGGRVVYVPTDARLGQARAAFRARLPEGATRFALPYALVPEGLVRDGTDVRFWGPLYPGEQQVSFTYAIPVSGGVTRLRLELPSGTDHLRVLVPADGPTLEAPALQEGEPVDVEQLPYRVLEARDLGPGRVVELAVAIPPTRREPDALSISHVRTFLELDDVMLAVSEEHHLLVDGDTPLIAPPDGPLLRVPLPPGARDVRLSPRALALGVTFERGALAVQGPVPPGRSRIDLAYRLPAEAGSTQVDRVFADPVPVLATYIADTGLRIDSQRLHRRRPVRSNGRLYLHFEAFHVAPGELVDLRLTPISTRWSLPDAAAVGFVGVASALAIAFLVGPLRSGRAGEEPEAPEVSPIRRERESLYASIRDLDHDHETGKVDDDDYAKLRGELRARAVALLREEQRAQAAASAAEREAVAPSRCLDCGARVSVDARFCSHCGRPLGAQSASGRGAGA